MSKCSYKFTASDKISPNARPPYGECDNWRAFDSIFCIDHKCNQCSQLKLNWSPFCAKCKCPDEDCRNLAYVCPTLCKCCIKIHGKCNHGTCKNCICSVCEDIPVQRTYQNKHYWGDFLLCSKHKGCIVKNCTFNIDISGRRYCKTHHDEIYKLIITLGVILKRVNIDKNIRKMILQIYQRQLENFSP